MRKRLIFVGIPEHCKTHSTDFFLTLLKNEYDVDYVDYEKSDEEIYTSADRIVFWQRPPAKRLVEALPANKIVFIPMYDEARNYQRATIRSLAEYRIISFCRSMHEDLVRFGFNSIYRQYFPEPALREPIAVERIGAYYWERETCYINEAIPFRIIEKLLEKKLISLHIHSEKPCNDGECFGGMEISRSSWFAEKTDMLSTLRKNSLYIAPRESEGIGMSFLEAIANGLAVVGADNPTMNEYISNEINGYLYNLLNPQPLNLKNLYEVRKRSLESCVAGFKRWERDKWALLDFIDEPAKGKKSVTVPRGFEYRSLKLAKPSFRLKRMAKRLSGK
jgi:glycosyltransferase involved in cell wall biosynthesis